MELRRFRVSILWGDLDDLREWLAQTRWPDELPGVGWDYGVPLGYVRQLADVYEFFRWFR